MTSENNVSSFTSEVGQVQALMAKYKTDVSFKAAFDAADSPEVAVQVAAMHGITVSARDIMALGKASDELLDEALGDVSGGGAPPQFNFSIN